MLKENAIKNSIIDKVLLNSEQNDLNLTLRTEIYWLGKKSDFKIPKPFVKQNAVTEDQTKSNNSMSPTWFECLNNNHQLEKSINFKREIDRNVALSNSSAI